MTLPRVQSPVFRLIDVVEFDVLMSEEDTFPTRLELFQSQSDPTFFRVRLWQIETFRVQPLFPSDATTGEPVDPPSDEEILLERTHYLHADFDTSGFHAGTGEVAITMTRDALERALRHASGDGGPAG